MAKTPGTTIDVPSRAVSRAGPSSRDIPYARVLNDAWDRAQGFASNVPPKATATASMPTGKTTPGTGGGILTKKLTWQGSAARGRVSAPSVTMTGSGLSTGARFNPATSARLILLSMGVGGAFIIVGGKNFHAYKTTVNTSDGGTKDVQVPGTLHAFTGLVIAGTIALVVNEVSPELGIVFALGLVFLAWNNVQAYESLGNVLLGKGEKQPAKTTKQILDSLPSGSVVQQSDGSQLVKPKSGNPYILRPIGNGEYSQEPVPQGVTVT